MKFWISCLKLEIYIRKWNDSVLASQKTQCFCIAEFTGKCLLAVLTIVRVRFVGEIFRTCPDQLYGPPSLVYNVYGFSFPGAKAAGAWR